MAKFILYYWEMYGYFNYFPSIENNGKLSIFKLLRDKGTSFQKQLKRIITTFKALVFTRYLVSFQNISHFELISKGCQRVYMEKTSLQGIRFYLFPYIHVFIKGLYPFTLRTSISLHRYLHFFREGLDIKSAWYLLLKLGWVPNIRHTAYWARFSWQNIRPTV